MHRTHQDSDVSGWMNSIARLISVAALAVAIPSLLSVTLLGLSLDWTHQLLLAGLAVAAVDIANVAMKPKASMTLSNCDSPSQHQGLQAVHLPISYATLPKGFPHSSTFNIQSMASTEMSSTLAPAAAPAAASDPILKDSGGNNSSTASIQHASVKPDPYIGELDELANRFVGLCNLEADPVGTGSSFKWQPVVDQTKGNFAIQVHQRTGHSVFFRVVVDLESTPEEAFDLLADITIRPTWDDMCETADRIESVSGATNIQYIRSKGVWPTAPRDALVVAFVKRLDDGRYLNVTHSIDSHPNYESISGDVRMMAHLAGVLVGPHPTKPNMTRCFQIVDGDLGGWLPQSVVGLVTTQAFPVSMRRVNTILKEVDTPRTVSKIIERAELIQKSGDIPADSIVAQTVPKAADTISDTASSLAKRNPRRAVTVASKRSVMSIFKFIYKILEKSQPLMVLVLFIAYFFKRK
ncbi:hypothetical protein MT418_005056 [Batrachochytrium dendrobatidis]